MSFAAYRVYQFKPDNKPRDIDTFLAGKIWSSTIENLNDPFEFAAIKMLADRPEKQAEFRQAGVSCFCRSRTNPLLWSHYASAHKGFAIGYDSTHPFFGGDKGITHRFLLDVRYEDSLPSRDRLREEEFVIAATLTKPTCWAYEQEMRLIKQIGNVALDIPRSAVKEICFGANMPKERVNEIINAIKSTDIDVEFVQMEFIENGFGVKPKWIY